MRQVFLFLGVAAGGASAWYVTKNNPSRVEYITTSTTHEPQLGTHFTAYESANYPDLTYAAENAVKAVVNIVASYSWDSHLPHPSCDCTLCFQLF